MRLLSSLVRKRFLKPTFPAPRKIVAVSILLTSLSASGANYTWTSTASGNWNTPGNWSPGVPVNSTSNVALFNAVDLTSDIAVHLNIAATLNSLNFGDTAPTGHNWLLDNNGSSSNTLTIGGGTPTVTVNNLTNGSTTISAEILGTAGLRKNGVGTLILTGSNASLSGASQVTLGTLGLGHDNALGSSTLSLNANLQSAPVELFAADGARTISNAVSLPNNGGFATIGGRENLTFSGTMTHAGGSASYLQINNTGLTTFSGGWALNNAGAAASNTTVSGTGDLVASSSITVGSSVSTSGLNKIGTGTLRLIGAYSAVSPVKADAGTVIINNVASSGVGITISGGKVVMDLNGFSTGVWNSGTTLTSGGGTLLIQGAPSGSSSQTLNQLTFTAGNANIEMDPTTGSSTTLNITTPAWTRSGGATAIIDLTRTGSTMTASPAITNGILSTAYAVVKDAGGIGFATRTSGGTGADIARYTSATALASNSNSSTTNFAVAPSSSTPFNWSSGITNRSVNSLSIDTSASNGTLDLGAGGNVLTITSKGLLMTGGNDYVIQNGQVGASANELIVHQYSTGVLTLAGTVSGSSGSLTKSGNGTLALTGSNSYTGATTINSGALRAADGVGLPSGSLLQLRGGVLESSGTFTRNLGTSGGNVNWGVQHAGPGGGFSANGGTLAIQLNNGTSSLTWGTTNFVSNGQALILGSTSADAMVDWQNGIVLNSALNVSHTREIRVVDNPASSTDIARISGLISGADVTGLTGGNDVIVKSGDGVLELTGANTYRGATVVTGGTLRVATLTDGGTASNIGMSGNAASNLVLNGATLQYIGSGTTTDRRFSAGTAGATIDASGTGALVLSNTGAVGLDAINIAGSNGARALTLTGSNTGDNTLAASIGDQGGATSVVKSGSGKWILTGVSTYSGSTTVNGGTFLLSNNASINSTSGIAVNIGTLNYKGTTGLTRDVTVNGGAFKYNSSAAYTGTLTLNSGTIGGSGNLSNTALSVGSSQTLSPGNSPGTLSTGSQTWASGGTYLWEINALATSTLPGSEGNDPGWDFTNITGSLTITAGAGQFNLNLDSLVALDNWNGAANYQWRIASASLGISGFSSNVFNIATGGFSENDTTGGSFSVTNAGNNIYLNYTASVPEPGALFLVYVGLATFWLLAPRRRRGTAHFR